MDKNFKGESLKIIVTGSIAFDYLMSFPGRFSDHFLPDKLDRISVSFLVDSMKQQRGGVAANIAYNLALLGEHPLLLGAVGKDFGPYGKELEGVGVDTSGVREYPDEYTASCFINTDQVENQIVSFYTGAMRFAGDLHLINLGKGQIDLVIVCPNDPRAMMMYPAECRDLHIPYIYDPSQQIVSLSGEAMTDGSMGAKLIILNEYELEMLKKKTGLEDEELLGLSETVVVTLGEKGSVIHTREGSAEIPPAQPERVIDPTGVGDAYRAGLMKGMVYGMPWEISGRMGSLAATYVLETDGPQSHTYDLKGFIQRYCQIFGESERLRRLVSY